MEQKVHREVRFDEGQKNSGRDKYERKFGHIPHEFTKGIYDSWDVNVTADSGTAIVEIKDRDIQFDKYDRPGKRDGYMIEEIKYIPMMKAYRASGCTPVFIIFFQDGIGYWWDLSAYDPEEITWEEKWCTETTADGSYGKVKRLKKFFNVFLKDGKRFKYE